MTPSPSRLLPSPGRLSALAVAAAMLGFVPVAAHAVRGYDNFNATPLSKFSKEDAAMMMARVDEALKAEKDGERLEWKNAASPAYGSVTPLARFDDKGVPCRRLRVMNAFGELKNEGVYKFCQRAGKWKLVGPDAG